MSDADDQDKTRIQPRQRKRAEPITSPEHNSSDFISAPTQAMKESGEYSRTGSLRDPKTQNSSSKPIKTSDLLKNRFVLERVLGAGGMGVVYKAKDLLKVEAQDRDPYVAIKVLGEEFKSHPEAFIALQRESRKTQRIAHPNIVNVHDFDKDGDTVFMTMEYLEGTPLDKLIKKHRGVGLPKDDAIKILMGVCSALAYAHAQRLIHSDLKPGNIFVTNAGLTKVFDFGIARAVAKAEQGDNTDAEDKTIFDAGNLGALTPAYASLEMLEGDSPDVRDDIYALGCIAYELFSGLHPYKRKNAKQAFRKGYKAERIKGITKRQWRAIESAIALEREERIGSVDEFWELFNNKRSGASKLFIVGIAASALLGVGAIQFMANPEPVPAQPQISEEEYRSELEHKYRLERTQKNLAGLFNSLNFDARWQAHLQEEIRQLEQLLGTENLLVQSAKDQAYSEYVNIIRSKIQSQSYDEAKALIENAQYYSSGVSDLAQFKTDIDAQLAAITQEKALAAQKVQAQKAAAAAKAAAQKKLQAKASSSKQFNAALKTVNDQLKCDRLLDMPAFEQSIATLKRTSSAKYQKAEPKIVSDLTVCIKRITRNFPSEGLKAQKSAQALFGNKVSFAASKTPSKDTCNATLAGLGTRGRRSRCQDTLSSGTKSPLTVVVPAAEGLKPFAIGRYEVSVSEYNQYCLATNSCAPLPASKKALPITGLSSGQIQGYLTWLSEQSGRIYRLPTQQEWTIAAKAKGRGLDSNRNCKLNIRGIEKGGSLVQAAIGQQNGWGLVNYVGNARELVTNGSTWLAVGGSYNTEMTECGFASAKSFSGSTDQETGFRVLREIQ